jgi:glycosyltransferase involved in cell wall biosynthesis
LGWPTLLELHDRPTGRFGPSLFRVFLRGSGAARLLTITEALRRWLADRYPFPARSDFTVVTPSGVDLERYEGLPDASTARRQLDIPDVFTAGYTGHLYPGRGLELMMELARLNPEIQMIWAGGEEPAVERWRRRVALSGPENLKLLGFISQTDLPLVQAACDVLMLPHEARVIASGGGDISAFTSPLKVFEYLAAGRAILASDLPVLREALDDHLAVFAPANDIQTWNRELGALRADPERRQRMGEGARAHARQFSWTARARKALLGLDVS